MLQAILITAYKDFNHLIDIVDFFDENFRIFIHIDKKSLGFKEIKETLSQKNNVDFISNTIKVNWGGRNHLRAILLLAKEALKNNKIERFHLISGHDFPVKASENFITFFKDNDTEYINCVKMPIERWPGGGLNRVEYFNFYDFVDAKKNRYRINRIVNFQKKLGFKRRAVKSSIMLYGGETWWSLTRNAVKYVIDYTEESPYLYNRMKHTFCSEEIYIPTVLMNSHFINKVDINHLRYIDWNDRNGNFPANLDMTDVKKIENNRFFFARKFVFPISNDAKRYFNTKSK